MDKELRIGVAGIGSAAAQILPSFKGVKGVALAGAADVRADARAEFHKAYDLPAFDTVAAMCRSSAIDAVWVATPNTTHCEHVLAAAEAGKHVICEKPMAVTLDECDRMIAAAARAGVQLVQGHSKIFDAPIRAMREVVTSGRIGRVIQINSWNFNDWLQRPRLASEVDTRLGGGLVYRQGPHMVDLVRYIAGGMATSVRGMAGRWDPHFDTEGNFSALLEFEGGVAASLGFNGYGYFDVTDLTWGIGEGGQQRPEGAPRKLKPRRTGPMEMEDKYRYVATTAQTETYARGSRMPFFGLTVVSCERGAIRQSPDGLYVYTEAGCEEVPVVRGPGRAAEAVELRDALAQGRTVFPDGRWGRATLEVCLAIMDSSRQHRDIPLSRQVPSA
ncbi:MAG TPA: Gfo/Idh/MocA family oxidoreductase [Stellaceae bacterium]|nr:Gfo/Idh/MocA family oxidoreductase [Stellaceae bacterium]